jgi:hypothetical protein
MPIFQYWNDWMSASSSLWEEQLLRMAGVWQRMATGEEGPEGFARDVTRLWYGWASTMTGLASFPAEWAGRRGTGTPTIAFDIDHDCESKGPVSAALAIDARGLTLGISDLQQVGAKGSIPASCVELSLSPCGRRLSAQLVNLGRVAKQSGNKLAPGLYAGLAHAYERPNFRPLAMIVVNVQPAGEAPPPAPPKAKK